MWWVVVGVRVLCSFVGAGIFSKGMFCWMFFVKVEKFFGDFGMCVFFCLIGVRFNYCFLYRWGNEVYMFLVLFFGLCLSLKCMISVLSRWFEFVRWVLLY